MAKGRLTTTNHDSAPRPKRSLFANPNINAKRKLALNSGIQTNQILTNDAEVCIPRLSSILLAVEPKSGPLEGACVHGIFKVWFKFSCMVNAGHLHLHFFFHFLLSHDKSHGLP